MRASGFGSLVCVLACVGAVTSCSGDEDTAGPQHSPPGGEAGLDAWAPDGQGGSATNGGTGGSVEGAGGSATGGTVGVGGSGASASGGSAAGGSGGQSVGGVGGNGGAGGAQTGGVGGQPVAGGAGGVAAGGSDPGTGGSSGAAAGGAGGAVFGGSGGAPPGGSAGSAGTIGVGGDLGFGGSTAGTAGVAGSAATGGAPGSGGNSGSGGDPGTGGDPGSGGTPQDPFADCPTADDYVGDSGWTHTAIATDDAVYCSTFNETRTLQQELAAKAMLRIAPGSYPLPDGGEDLAFALPLCLYAPVDGAVGFDPGTVRHTSSTYGGRTAHTHIFAQTLTTDGRELQGRITFEVGAGDPLETTLDGRETDIMTGTGFSASLCVDPNQCYGVDALRFDSCTHASSTLNTHFIEFADGSSVDFHLRIGQSLASTEPGAFVRAVGTFAGVSFDQQDYFRLVYRPEHHHFVRNFVVLFAAPIQGACGIEVSNVEPFWGPSDSAVAYTVDCDLNRLDELTISSVTVPEP